MKKRFYYNYYVARGTRGYSHPTITIYEPSTDGEFSPYRDIGEIRGQCHEARDGEEAKVFPYALTTNVKLQYGNAVLMAKILSELNKTGPWGIEYRAIVNYLRKNGCRMIYSRERSEYFPAEYRKSIELYIAAKKRGMELKRAI